MLKYIFAYIYLKYFIYLNTYYFIYFYWNLY